MATTTPLYFNASAYLMANPDVMAAIDSGRYTGTPLQHFLDFGIKEGRPLDKSGTTFNEAAYLKANPDVAAAGIPALQHFLQSGYRENRPLGATASQSTLDSITSYYKTYLGRTPDAEGLAYWASAVVNGTPLSSIQQTLQTSPEAKGYAATAQITSAYNSYLGRAPNAEGLDFWRQAVANGTSVADVIKSIQTSPEAKFYSAKPALISAYQTYLGRTPTQTDLDYWLQDIESGATVAQMTSNIKASPEAKGYAATADITKAYKDFIGREPDAEGLDYWRMAVANGTPISEVVSTIKTSPDARAYNAKQNGLSIFNEASYLAANPDVAADVAAGKTTALQHFLTYGAKEGRPIDKAGNTFDDAAYLAANPDVAASVAKGETTALEHYIKYGVAENRAWDGTAATVNNAFETYIGRAPNAEEMTYWKGQIKDGKLTTTQFTDALKKNDAAATYRTIENIYQTVLGRAPELEGIKFWWDEINSGRIKDTSQLSANIINSPEAAPYRTIATAYQKYTGALPTASDVNKWRDQVKSGQLTEAQLAENIKALPAAQAYVDKSLSDTYKTYFGREPDATGLAFWKQAVADGMSLEEAIQTMRSSPESTKYMVEKSPKISFNAAEYLKANPDVMKAIDDGTFKGTPLEHYLQYGIKEGRPANEAGNKFNSAAYLAANPDVKAAIESGSYKGTALDHYLEIGSKEGRAWSTAQIINTQNDLNSAITSAYVNAFGKEPTAAELANWSRQINSGAVSIDDLNNAVLKSPEYKDLQASKTPLVYADDRPTAITQIYQNWLGRTPNQAELADWVNGGMTIDAIYNQVKNSDEARGNRAKGSPFWIDTVTGYSEEGNALKGAPVFVPSSVASLPGASQAIMESQDPAALIAEITADPAKWMQGRLNAYAWQSGWLSKTGNVTGDLYTTSRQAGFDNVQDWQKFQQGEIQKTAQWLVDNGVMTGDTVKNTWDSTFNTSASTAQTAVVDQIHNDGGNWLTKLGDDVGDFLEKYEIAIMVSLAAPAMGAGFAALAAGASSAAAAAGGAAVAAEIGAASAAAGLSAEATAAAVAAASATGMTASAITAAIMGLANTGMALGQGVDWDKALKSGLLSSAGAFIGTQLAQQIGGAVAPAIQSTMNVTPQVATQITNTITTSVGGALSGGISAAITGKDIGDAMLITGLSSAVGSALTQITGNQSVGSVLGGTATGMIAGQDIGTALSNSAFRGIMTLMSGMMKDGGVEGTVNSLKGVFTNMFQAGEKVADYFANGMFKYTTEPTSNWTLTDRIAEAINPEFNPDEYRRINGLGAGVEAGTDYLTRGMEVGAPVNAAEAKPMIDARRFQIAGEWAVKMGYPSIMVVPEAQRADLLQKIDGMYGDNLAALNKATPDSMLQENPSLGAGDFLPRANPSTFTNWLDKSAVDKFVAPGWYQPGSSVFKMPDGMRYASQTEIAGVVFGDEASKVYTAMTGNGKVVYLTTDKSYVPPKTYDANTGTLKVTQGAGMFGTKTYDNMSPEEKMAWLQAMDKASDSAKEEVSKQYPTLNAITAKATQFLTDLQSSSLPDWAKSVGASIIASGGSWTYNTFGAIGKQLDMADASLTGSKEAGTFTSIANWGKSLDDVAKATIPAAFQASVNEAKDLVDSAKDPQETAQAFYKIAKDYSLPVISTMVAQEIGEEVPASTAAAVLSRFGTVGKMLGFGVEMIDAMSESFMGGYDSTKQLIVKEAMKAGMPREVAEQYAENQAVVGGYGSMGVTAVLEGVLPDTFAKWITGTSTKEISETVVKTAVDKLYNFGKMVGVETIKEGAEGAAQSTISGLLVNQLYPDAVSLPKEATAGFFWEAMIGGPTSVGAGAYVGGVDALIGSVAAGNAQLTSQLAKFKTGDYTMGELGAVLNQWIPPAGTALSTGVFESIRENLVTDVLSTNTQFADNYSTPKDYIDAVKDELGVWQPVVLADVAASVPKFAGQVTTLEQGFQLLKDAGLSNPTQQDVINSGILGITDQSKIALLPSYVSTITGAQPTTPVTPTTPTEPTTPVTPTEPTTPTTPTEPTTPTTPTTTTTPTDLQGVKDSILAKVEEYQAKNYSSDQALQAALDTVALNLGTTKNDLLSQLGTTETALRGEITTQVSQTESRLADLIAKNETEGLARDQATQKAVDDLATEMGTTRTDILSKIDLTSQQFQNEISIAKTDLTKQMTVYGQQTAEQINAVKTQIQNQMTAYQQAGIDRDTALGLAVAQVSQDLGTTKADLLTKLGTSETNLRNEFTQQTTALSTQVQDVAKLLGKPASQVTANDITMVQNMIAQQTATNLAYDVNQDQKVDAADLTLLQQQQQIQQQQNVKTVVDPTTGVTTYVDTTTNQPITGFDVTGTQWAPTGIYDVLEKQKIEQEQIAKTQAETAKTATQKGQFGQLMSLLFQAPDAGGQQVTVKTPDPSKINYIYDWSSIFANPSQASLMPSPYGPMNSVAPQQKQGGIMGQAANDAYGAPYKMAVGGFAEGGIVNGNDMEVGGGNVDDLINILKGNSG